MIINIPLKISKSMLRLLMQRSLLTNGKKVIIIFNLRVWKRSRKQRILSFWWPKAKNCINKMSYKKASSLYFWLINKCSWYGYLKNSVWKLETNFERKNKHLNRSQISNNRRFRQNHCDERRKNNWKWNLPRIDVKKRTFLQIGKGSLIN